MGLFSFIGDIAGKLLGTQSSRDAASQQRQQAQTDYERQKEFAQNAIQWRTQDAKAAGIHPLYALGSQGMSFQPAGYIDGGGSDHSWTSNLGQNIDRALMKGMSKEDRVRAVMRANEDRGRQIAGDMLNQEHQSLQNDLLRLRLAKELEPSQIGPGTPNPYSYGNTTERVQPVPAAPTIDSMYNPSREAGRITDYGYTLTPQGGLVPSMSYDFKQRTDEDIIGSIMWNLRNRIAPNFNRNHPAPSTREFPLRNGFRWQWSHRHQQYLPAPVGQMPRYTRRYRDTRILYGRRVSR